MNTVKKAFSMPHPNFLWYLSELLSSCKHTWCSRWSIELQVILLIFTLFLSPVTWSRHQNIGVCLWCKINFSLQSYYGHTHTHTLDERERGCCWKAFHTDVHGKWWKPHKAGPVTAILLVMGWILFVVFFGWIVLMALVLVAILIGFSYCCNFICTGKCQLDEEEEQEQAHITTAQSRAEAGHAQSPHRNSSRDGRGQH